MADIKTVNLLWTGGWDSTFRLLTLAANEDVRIHIYYVMQPKTRKSTPIELQTMDNILKDIYVHFPGSKDRILSITHFEREKIERNDHIRKQYDALNKVSPFGAQYPWLAEFALMHNLSDLEMSIAKNDGRVYLHLKNICESVEDPVIGTFYRISSSINDDSPHSMFKYFNFPTIMFTKIEMKRIAEEAGTYNILNKSWFCHTPVNGKPCGVCNPCVCAIEEGMSFRLPWQARARYRCFKPILKPVQLLVEVGFLDFIKRAVHKLIKLSFRTPVVHKSKRL